MDIFALEGQACPWSAIRDSREVCGDTSSDESFTQISEWLRNCAGHHTACKANTDRLPNRVIDVGTLGSPLVRLYETTNKIAPYACLSHCWGKTPINRTTSETYAQHLESISWDSLSRTFQDAITVVRRLGLQYLWIDSLCVVQDSEGDWQKESALMASIYGNAYLTIAATKSSSGSGGCFSTAAQEHRALKLNLIDDNTGVAHPIYVRRQIPHYDPNATRGRHYPLLTRAWCFQERLLSPRVLHFGSQELLWECLSDASRECTRVRGRSDIRTEALESISTNLERLMLGKVTHMRALSSSHSRPALAVRWRNIVEEYSGLDLTYGNDKFPAISGTANQMRIYRPKAKYLAGLWEDDLIQDLLWEPFQLEDHRPETWRAPSWSWASVNGQIRYTNSISHPTRRIIVEVLDARVIPVIASNDMGRAKSGYLVLSGPLVPATLHLRPQPYIYGRLTEYEISAASAATALNTESLGFKSDYTLVDWGEQMVYCLWMVIKNERTGFGMALKRVAVADKDRDGDCDVYERIGTVWTWREVDETWETRVGERKVVKII
ncbi:MAG: hypothetical protein M1840_000760 [Geoglossum simile]|nr:MAG: hypothetical protein M1840_000760 [Geoglossum simile]